MFASTASTLAADLLAVPIADYSDEIRARRAAASVQCMLTQECVRQSRARTEWLLSCPAGACCACSTSTRSLGRASCPCSTARSSWPPASSRSHVLPAPRRTRGGQLGCLPPTLVRRRRGGHRSPHRPIRTRQSPLRRHCFRWRRLQLHVHAPLQRPAVRSGSTRSSSSAWRRTASSRLRKVINRLPLCALVNRAKTKVS